MKLTKRQREVLEVCAGLRHDGYDQTIHSYRRGRGWRLRFEPWGALVNVKPVIRLRDKGLLEPIGTEPVCYYRITAAGRKAAIYEVNPAKVHEADCLANEMELWADEHGSKVPD